MKQIEDKREEIEWVPVDVTAPRKKRKRGEVGWCLLMAALILASLFLAVSALNAGTDAVSDSYEDAKKKAEEDSYRPFYDKGYKDGWDTYHVTNRAVINIGELKEEANLEVLEFYDVEYEVPEDEESLLEKLSPIRPTKVWLEVPGKGKFVVDLRMAELIVDDARKYVLVRVPTPKIDAKTFTIYGNIKTLYVEKGGILNDGPESGAKKVWELTSDAQERMWQNAENDQSLMKSAKKSTVQVLTSFIKKLNPDMPDIQVEIQFIDET